MKEINVDGFCYGENHKRCYFFKEEKDGKKFCGLWMRNVKGSINPRKKEFKCTFCNVKKVTLDSNGGPVYNDTNEEFLNNGSITISNV
jgi:hypothetical protein